MQQAAADTFAAEWIAAWNSHDLERILSHYADDVVVASPLMAGVLGPGHDRLRGKSALRAYWAPALDKFPDLHFVLHRTLPGVDSLVLCYRSVRNLDGAEFMRFEAQGLVCEVQAHYTPAM
jgi:hypothetical protein